MDSIEKKEVSYTIDKDGNINERKVTNIYKDGVLVANGVAHMSCYQPNCDEGGLPAEVKGLIKLFHTEERKAPFIARRLAEEEETQRRILAEEEANAAREDVSITD